MNKSPASNLRDCPICASALEQSITPYTWICPECLYEGSNLSIHINGNTLPLCLNETARETGLKATRNKNFKVILNSLKDQMGTGKRLLEVGAGHGWFLEAAQQDFEVLGIEPDAKMAEKIRAKGLPVIEGFFPECFDATDQFDVIVFNDVLEHMPDLKSTLAKCRTFLKPEGVLAICLPSSKGILYRTSKIFYEFGFAYPHDRIWQKGLPSPHLHYMNPANLTLLLEMTGFRVEKCTPLPSMHRDGLLNRIRLVKRPDEWPVSTSIYLGLVLGYPILTRLPSDIFFALAQPSK